MDWNNYIQLFNNSVPINLNQKDDGTFSFSSTLNTTIYGKFYKPNTQNPMSSVIVLFHGLGAVIKTSGYQYIKDFWLKKGFYVIGMDVRNQGGMTKGLPISDQESIYLSGIQSRNTYYYYQVFLDAYRLVDVAKLIFPGTRIYATGGSQGGTLALFVGIFHPSIELVMADMPSCIDIPYLINNSDSGFKSVLTYLEKNPNEKDVVMDILKQIDLYEYALELKKPTLISSGTLDQICPLRSTQLFYQKIECVKKLVIYEGYGHGGYDDLHFDEKRDWIHQYEESIHKV